MSNEHDAASQVSAAIDALLSLDVGALSPDQLHTLGTTLVRQQSRLAVAVGDILVDWTGRAPWQADGTLRPQRALARDSHSCDRSRRQQLWLARRLQEMPLTHAAVLDGRLSVDHALLFVRAATPSRLALFQRDEQLLIDHCAGHDVFADSRRTVAYWVIAADDELGIERRRPEPSTLYHSTSETTGEGFLDGHLSAVDNEIVKAELDRLVRRLLLDDRRNKVTRTRSQRRAAALVLMAARSASADGPTVRPLIQIIVGDLTARRLCQTAAGIVLHPDDVVPLLDDAVIESFLFDGPATVIAKSTRRTFTGALRAAIKVRDRRCTHRSGCDTPAVHADIDHRRPSARGGSTDQFNGRVECVPHNRLAHLHDDDEPLPERSIDTLDAIRCRLRWSYLQELEHADAEAPAD